MESIKESLSSMADLFNSRMNEFQQNLQKSSSPATVTSLTADFNSFKKFILIALNSLQKQVEFLSRDLDRQDMRTRRKMLLFHGVPEDKEEVVTARVTSIIAEHLNLPNFSSASIKESHRLGRPSERPRPIAIKFTGIDVRNKVWFAKTKLKGSGFTQSEFLTKTRHDAFLAARQRFGINNCWTRDGCIFVIGTDGKRHRAVCLADVEGITDQVPIVPQLVSTSPVAPNPVDSKGNIPRSKRLATRK